MNETSLFDQLEFTENPVYEGIISDLQERQYSVCDGFFDLEEVSELRESLHRKHVLSQFKKAAIGSKTNEIVERTVRGDFIFWLNEAEADPSENRFFRKINELTNYLNRTCFMGILHKEFHYAIYPAKTFYKRHLDTFQNDDRRKLSFVCYLNEDWNAKNGGELVLYPQKDGTENVVEILPLAGRVVIFESQVLEHEVKPVLACERLSITGWFKTR
ncbi:MAG TPA: 2OG-Fe(II) oxygenase [Flavobacteriaceae bacterium]|nr:2OG-Fe(II) oxygenase [Flavobacteriaceae bacterium]